MDKNTFETYEYLPGNNIETESDQFFVIQDDGTLLLNRQVQYVAEVQDVNATTDSAPACTMYDMSPQQFFVGVGNNPTELISVPENYILPSQEDEENNLYGNSFLLQTINTEQSAKDLGITVQFKDAKEQEVGNADNIIDKQGTSFTEITLSEEQYSSLEQKGWVLLENNGKIFVLDSFGLHEVTANQDLLQNLKDDTKIDLPVETADSKESVKYSYTNPLIIDDIVVQNSPSGQENIDLPVANEERDIYKDTDKDSKLEINITNEENHNLKPEINAVQKDPVTKPEETLQPELKKYKNSKIKILTKYNFKDIPDKIVLGRTRSGKKVVAKVVKRTVNNRKFPSSDEAKPKESTLQPPETLKNKNSSKDIDDVEFEGLVRRAVAGEVMCSSRDVVDASDVITQLFQVQEFSATVSGRNFVITKVTEKSSNQGTIRSVSFVTGFAISAEKTGLLFIHVPNLLQKLTNEYEDYFNSQSSRSVLKPLPERLPDCKILQVHISETKHNAVQAISFILNERFLPCTCADNKAYPRKINKLHACGSCASIFQSEAELTDHQESHTVESDGALTIDTDKLPKDVQTFKIMGNRYYVVKTDKGTEYCCFQCSKKFNKLSNFVRHMKATHPFTTPKENNKNKETCTSSECKCEEKCENYRQVHNVPVEAPYKCKMCSCSYYYPGSLTKHISKAHLMVKVNTLIQT